MSDAKKPSARRIVPAPITTESLKTSNEAQLLVTSFQPTRALKSHIGVIMSDAYSIIATELRRLRQKAERGQPLTLAETKQMATYIEQMVRVSKEERVQEQRNDPSALSDSELLEQALTALKAFLPKDTYERMMDLLPSGADEMD